MSISSISGMGYQPYNYQKSNKKTARTGNYADISQKAEERMKELSEREESKTKNDIIVKPDGSRVLVVTMSVGGMETTMSLEISKPTNILNNISGQHSGNHDTAASETDMDVSEIDTDSFMMH